MPMAFRVGGISPNADVPGAWHDAVPDSQPQRDRARRPVAGSVNAAYFYKGLSLIGEWQYGYGTLRVARPPTHRRRCRSRASTSPAAIS